MDNRRKERIRVRELSSGEACVSFPLYPIFVASTLRHLRSSSRADGINESARARFSANRDLADTRMLAAPTDDKVVSDDPNWRSIYRA